MLAKKLKAIMKEKSFTGCDEVHSVLYRTATELMRMQLPSIYFAVKDVLPMGLSIIASPPKFGKSYLALQLCIAVTSGKTFLGFDTNKSGALYLALEDSWNRLKERIGQLLQGENVPDDFHIAIESASIGTGLIDELQEQLSKYPSIKLIVIDTFQKVRDGFLSSEGPYGADYREASVIKKFADANGIAVLLIHHTRKMKDQEDVFANISGTHGLTGAMDTMMVLAKDKRADNLTHLHITGRDVYMSEYGLYRDEKTGLWLRHEESIEELQSRARQNDILLKYEKSPIRKTILYLTEGTGKWSGRCNEIIAASKESGTLIEDNPLSVSNMLTEFEAAMEEIDGIRHLTIKNGTGAKIHRIEKIFRY